MIKLDLKESVECRIQDADWDYKLDIGKFNTVNGFYNETVNLITPTEDGKKHIESIVKRKSTHCRNSKGDSKSYCRHKNTALRHRVKSQV